MNQPMFEKIISARRSTINMRSRGGDRNIIFARHLGFACFFFSLFLLDRDLKDISWKEQPAGASAHCPRREAFRPLQRSRAVDETIGPWASER